MSDVESNLDTMTENFHLASEAKQRVTREIYTHDEEQIMLVSELLNESISLVYSMYQTMGSSTHLASLYGVRDVLVEGQHVMRDQYNEYGQLLASRHLDLLYQLRSPYHNLGHFRWGYGYLEDLINTLHISWIDQPLIDYLETYTLVEALQHCLQNNMSMEALRDNMDIPYNDILEYNSSIVTNETFCLYLVPYKIGLFDARAHNSIDQFVNLDSYFANSLLLYESGLSDIFNETGIEQQDFAEYWDCLAGINESKRALTVLEELIVNATKFGEQDSLEGMLAFALYMEETFHGQEVTYAYKVSLNSYTGVCKWPFRYSAEVTYVDGNEEYLVKESAFDLMETAMSCHELAVNKYERNLDELRAIFFSQQEIVPLVDLLMSYLARDITKLELTDIFTSLAGPNLQLVTEYDFTVSVFFHLIEEMQTAINTIHYYYASAYDMLEQLKLPVYNYTLLRESPLWKELLEPSPNISLEGLIYNITNHKHWTVPFDDLFESLFEPFLSYPYAQAEVIDNVNTEFVDAVNAYNEYLQGYKEELEIDNEFYL